MYCVEWTKVGWHSYPNLLGRRSRHLANWSHPNRVQTASRWKGPSGPVRFSSIVGLVRIKHEQIVLQTADNGANVDSVPDMAYRGVHDLGASHLLEGAEGNRRLYKHACRAILELMRYRTQSVRLCVSAMSCSYIIFVSAAISWCHTRDLGVVRELATRVQFRGGGAPGHGFVSHNASPTTILGAKMTGVCAYAFVTIDQKFRT